MSKTGLLSTLVLILGCAGCNQSKSWGRSTQQILAADAGGHLEISLEIGSDWQKMASPPKKSEADAMFPERRLWFENDSQEYLSVYVSAANAEFRESQLELTTAILDGSGPKHLQDIAELFEAKRSGESQVRWAKSNHMDGGITGYRRVGPAELIVVYYQADKPLQAADSVLEFLNSAKPSESDSKK